MSLSISRASRAVPHIIELCRKAFDIFLAKSSKWKMHVQRSQLIAKNIHFSDDIRHRHYPDLERMRGEVSLRWYDI
jgi:hypothetical protein